MATLSDLKEVKEALDAGLVSQADYDAVKRDYFRAKQEAIDFQKRELRAKEEFQKKELRAKEEALDAKKEFQKMELQIQKRELLAREAFQKRKADAELRTYALESIVKHGSSIMSEDQKVGLVRDYAEMSGLDCKTASKRQRPSLPQPATPPARAAIPPPADAPTPADEDDYSNYSDDDGEDDSDYDEPQAAKRTKRKKWIEEEDAALVTALRAGQKPSTIKIGGRPGCASYVHLQYAREHGKGSKPLREYLEETYPDYVCIPPKTRPWSVDEDQTFIQAHREGKTLPEIAPLLPGRTHRAVEARWSEAKTGKSGTAALRAYAAECRKA